VRKPEKGESARKKKNHDFWKGRIMAKAIWGGAPLPSQKKKDKKKESQIADWNSNGNRKSRLVQVLRKGK